MSDKAQSDKLIAIVDQWQVRAIRAAIKPPVNSQSKQLHPISPLPAQRRCALAEIRIIQ
jgi:hypothetical protein